MPVVEGEEGEGVREDSASVEVELGTAVSCDLEGLEEEEEEGVTPGAAALRLCCCDDELGESLVDMAAFLSVSKSSSSRGKMSFFSRSLTDTATSLISVYSVRNLLTRGCPHINSL